MSNSADPHELPFDKPIRTRDEDCLLRREFSDSIANTIRDWKGADSLCVGLYGQWGCGKTSVVNMVLEALRESDEGKPYIVDFNPWRISSREQLIAELFLEIAHELGGESGEQNKKLIVDIQTYLAVVAYGATIYAASTVLTPEIAETMGPQVATAIAVGAKATKTFVKELSQFRKKDSGEYDEALSSMRQRLHQQLRDLDRALLIVIDDIDRLEPSEVHAIFRLVKVNLDFPKVIFLLSFQRDTVEAMLGDKDLDGAEYLKKVIQIGFDLPAVQRGVLERTLTSNLDMVIGKDLADKRLFDSERWQSVFSGGLARYFKNLRDIYRFLWMLRFHVELFRRNGKLEVNVVDVVALEVLRVFEHVAYHRVRAARSLLTTREGALLDWKKDVAKMQVLDISKGVSDSGAVDTIVQELFPNAQWAYSDTSIGWGCEYQEEWLRDLRVAHPENFDRYFVMAIPEYDISEEEMTRILSEIDNPSQLMASVLDLRTRGLLETFLDRLSAGLDSISTDKIHNIIIALFDVGDQLREKEGSSESFFAVDLSLRLSHIVDNILRLQNNDDSGAKLLAEAVKTSKGLFVPLIIVNREQLRYKEPSRRGKPLVNEGQLNDLKTMCVDKIKSLATTGYMGQIEFLDFVLDMWSEWGDINDAKKWLEDAIEDDKVLLAVLVGFLHSVNITGGGAPKTCYYTRLEEIEKYTSVEDFDDKLKDLNVAELSNTQKIGVETFNKATKKRAKNDGSYERWLDRHGEEWSR